MAPCPRGPGAVSMLRVHSSLETPDVYGALGMESGLLDEGPGEDPVLFLWRAPPSVVMGKNQNPWRECHLEVLRERRVLLARRETGGGAVYHDPGNLNLCWAMPRSEYRADRLHGILLEALALAGVRGEVRKGGAIWANGRKISGCAFGYRRDRVLHHATLLVEADLSLLKAVLAPPRVRLRTHAVSSLPAPVANVSAWKPGLSLVDMAAYLVVAARGVFGPPGDLPGGWCEGAAVRGRAARMASAEWIWWRTPRFRIQIDPAWGPLALEVHRGRVEHVECRGRRVETAARFDRVSLRELDRDLGLEPGELETALRREGWWLPSVVHP